MGGLINILPFTYTMILIGSLSLMALPFLTGYYSKDLILEVAYGQFLVSGTFTYWLGTITAIITAFYSTKTLILGFLGKPSSSGLKKIYNTHEASLIMSIPLILLSICSIFIGYIAKDFFIGIGSSCGIGNNSFPSLGFDLEFISTTNGVQFYPLFASLFGILLAIILIEKTYIPLISTNPTGPTARTGIRNISHPNLTVVKLTKFFNQKYWFDNIYNNLFISASLHGSGNFSYVLDKGFLSLFGPRGLGVFLFSLSRFFAIQFDTGFIPHYALILLFSLFLVI